MSEGLSLIGATIEGIQAAMAVGKLTSRELVQQYLNRIAAYDQQGPALNSIQALNPRALEEADAADARRRSGVALGPMDGIPVLLKDQAETRDMPTTYSSELFKGFMPGRDATIVTRLRAAGAIIIAKNTMSEYALPGFHGSAFGFARNAFKPDRIPGGSSCGTGASVAACFGAVGIGEDTGGSIRNPASFNSLVGLRPTVGLVSRHGLLPGTPTRDTMGPMTRTVRDAAILLDVIAGFDPNDPVTAHCVGRVPTSYTSFLTSDGLQGKRLGVVRSPIGGNTNTAAADYAQIWRAIEEALREMQAKGAEIVEPVDVDHAIELAREPGGGGETEEAYERYFAAHPNAPAHTLHEIVLSADHMVTPSARAALADKLGKSTRDPEYLRLLQIREELRDEVLARMAEHRLDALVYPTINHDPGPIPGDILTSHAPRNSSGSNGPLSSATAYPSLTVPAGFTEAGLPVGLSLFGGPFSEGTLLQIAYAFERPQAHPSTTPPLPGEL